MAAVVQKPTGESQKIKDHYAQARSQDFLEGGAFVRFKTPNTHVRKHAHDHAHPLTRTKLFDLAFLW